MSILAKILEWLGGPGKQTSQQTATAFFPAADYFIGGQISDWYSHDLLGRIAANWDEAKGQLYHGSFARCLIEGGRPDWAALAARFVEAETDRDIGLFGFAVNVSLSASKHVNTYDMLEVARAAVQGISPLARGDQRVERMLALVPPQVRVYQEDDDRSGFFHSTSNEAYEYLASLLR